MNLQGVRQKMQIAMQVFKATYLFGKKRLSHEGLVIYNQSLKKKQ
jgi:hypothetical protein